MTNILIIDSKSSILYQHYKNTPNIYFLDNSFYSDFERWRKEIDSLLNIQDYYECFNFKQVYKYIESIIPIWSRWTSSGDRYDNYFHHFMWIVFYLTSYLKKNNINAVIFPTSAPHHLDTSILSIACRHNNIPQIFLYIVYSSENNGKYGRLLPLIVEGNLSDRKALDYKISNYKNGSDYKNYIKFMNNLNSESSSNIFILKDSESLLKSVIDETFYEFKKKLVRLYRPSLKSNNEFKEQSYFIKLNQFFDQSKALKFYEKNISKNYIRFLDKEANIVIMAHFQPEMTSFPEGGDYHNHLKIVYFLRSIGFKKPIFYKEHPSSWSYRFKVVGPTKVSISRSESYYKQLLNLGCVFLDKSFKLDFSKPKSAFLPITITGSIAIERSISGYYTLFAGHPWWKGLPGTIYLSDLKSESDLKEIYFNHNQNISSSAMRFFEKLLNEKTIVNYLGYATGEKIDDDDIKKTFFQEYDSLISYLTKF